MQVLGWTEDVKGVKGKRLVPAMRARGRMRARNVRGRARTRVCVVSVLPFTSFTPFTDSRKSGGWVVKGRALCLSRPSR